jgi:hypothetical protein
MIDHRSMRDLRYIVSHGSMLHEQDGRNREVGTIGAVDSRQLLSFGYTISAGRSAYLLLINLLEPRLCREILI